MVDQQTSAQRQEAPAAQILESPVKQSVENQQQLQSVEAAQGLELARAECRRRPQEQRLQLELAIEGAELVAQLPQKELQTRSKAAAVAVRELHAIER